MRAGVTFAIERAERQPAEEVAVSGVSLFPPGGARWVPSRYVSHRATYLRFRVEALGKNAVRDCTAHLIALRKFDVTTGRLVDLGLPHVISLGPPEFDVLPYAHRTPGRFIAFAVEGEGVSETLTANVLGSVSGTTSRQSKCPSAGRDTDGGTSKSPSDEKHAHEDLLMVSFSHTWGQEMSPLAIASGW